jgi:hypothetical protein
MPAERQVTVAEPSQPGFVVGDLWSDGTGTLLE